MRIPSSYEKLAEMPLRSVFRAIQKIDDKKRTAGERHAEHVGDKDGKGDAGERGAGQLRDNQSRAAGALLAAEEPLHLVARHVVPMFLTPRRIPVGGRPSRPPP